jgi:hypothetical protein
MHPTNRKVYLILISVAFNGLLKSQGAKVKLMVCKKTQSKMHKKCMETKTFTKMQNHQLFNERLLFFSKLLRFYAVNMKDFQSDLRATYT